MNLLSLESVEKTYDGSPLFADSTIGINAGERIGLVGRNGSGKSVLLKLLASEIEPDAGTISRNRSLRIATLEQNPFGKARSTLREFLYLAKDSHILLSLEYAGALKTAGESVSMDAKLANLVARMEETDGFAMEDRYLSLLVELGVGKPDDEIGKLSGGMLRKAAMARCLAGNANLVLLDEPTNHLDIDTIEWLENYLKRNGCAFVLVTHDRYVLESVCNAIIEIEGGSLYKYVCDYSTYLERKQHREDSAYAAENRRRARLAIELKWLRQGARARTGKEKARKNKFEQLNAGERKTGAAMGEFSSAHRRLGKKVLKITNITKSYDGKTVLDEFSYSFRKGETIGIIGPNGSGKSTFLDIIAGVRNSDSGEVVAGDNTAFAYFDQTGDKIDSTLTVIEYMRRYAERVEVEDGNWLTAEQFLERFMFPRSMFSQSLELLSGGEFRRLFLVRLLAAAPNFLLLDEPTNDLDIDTIRLLEEYLAAFPGCIVAVSHDRAFLDRITDGLFIFDGDGGIRNFGGNYSEFARERDEKAMEQRAEKPRTGKQVQRKAATGLSFRETRELEHLPSEMETLELEKSELEAVFQDPSTAVMEMEQANQRYSQACALLEQKSDRWLELAEREDG